MITRVEFLVLAAAHVFGIKSLALLVLFIFAKFLFGVLCLLFKLCSLMFTPMMNQDRRRIESDLFCGKLCGIVATNALELGIDVGHIDVTLHLGFPGSIAR